MHADVAPDRPRDAQLRAVGSAFLRRRPWIVGAAFVAQAALLVASPAPRAQVRAVLTGFALMQAFFTWEAVVRATSLVTARGLLASLLVTLGGVTAAVIATGGAASPLVPVLLAPTVVGFAAFGRAAEGRVFLGAVAAVAAALLVVPAGVPFPPLTGAEAGAMRVVALLTTAALLWVGVAGLSDAYARVGDALAGAGDELAATAAARHAAMEALGAQVAHEIKNPLTAIKGLAELMAERATDARDRERLAVMTSEAARIEDTLRAYLSVARPLEAVARVDVELGALLRPFEHLLGARAERAGVALRFEGGEARASVDPRRVKEAVLNLCLNALEATPQGGTVTVRWAVTGAAATITVTDDGRGMSPEVLARAGVGGGFTTRDEGHGLGLRLARRVAEEHGGELVLDSAPGRGTRAELRLGGVAR